MEKAKNPANGHSQTPSGAELLNDIESFFRRYLVCDDHQRTILTLWSACARAPKHFAFAPYLDIRSPEPHSGKTLSLTLLACICHPGHFLSGVPAGTLMQRFLTGRSAELIDPKDGSLFTVLLDDCQHSFGPSERQPIIALLNSGSDVSNFFAYRDEDYYIFGPKAFAGNASLPRSLASRCIPILLRRPSPSEKFTRIESEPIGETGEALNRRLKEWLQQISPALQQVAGKVPANVPPGLSPGQRKCAEPLLHIADLAGGLWPAKTRAAVAAIFDVAEISFPLQLLSDVRAIFGLKENPEYLSTADLLTELRAMEDRPWSGWTAKSGRRIASHLGPFGIISRRQNQGPERDSRGYFRDDLQDAWERYLRPLAPPIARNELALSCAGNAGCGGTQITSAATSGAEISAIGAD